MYVLIILKIYNKKIIHLNSHTSINVRDSKKRIEVLMWNKLRGLNNLKMLDKQDSPICSNEVATKLLETFSQAYDGIEQKGKELFIRFRYYNGYNVESSLYSHIFRLTYELEPFKINDLEYIVRQIIRTCDRSLAHREGMQDEIRLTVSKYVLADFITDKAKDLLRIDVPIMDKIRSTFKLEPIDSSLVINGTPVTTVNGVYTSIDNPNSVLDVVVSHPKYHTLTQTFEVSNNQVYELTLEHDLKSVHLISVPMDATIDIYRDTRLRNLSINADNCTNNIGNSLTDAFEPSSITDKSFRDMLEYCEKVELEKKGDMLCGMLPLGETYLVRVQKYLYQTVYDVITINDEIHKLYELKKQAINVHIDLDPVFADALVSINGMSIETPYDFEIGIGDFVEIMAKYGELEYRNFIVGSQADVTQGLSYLISFIKRYDVDINCISSGARLYINNELQALPYFSGTFTEMSKLEIRVEAEGYVPLLESFYVTKDVQKQYKLTELTPRYRFNCTVEPVDSFMSINGNPVRIPFAQDFIEGSEIKIRASREGYEAIEQVLVITEDTDLTLELKEIKLFNPTVYISCDVTDAIAKVNGKEIDMPIAVTTKQGTWLDLEISAVGYKTYHETIRVLNADITRDITMIPLSDAELQDMVNVVINVNRINSIVMLNNALVTGEVIQDGTDVINHKFAAKVPRGTLCALLVTNPGYAAYSTSFVADIDKEINVKLTKNPAYELKRLNLFCNTLGASVNVNGVDIATPFVKDYELGTYLDIKAHCDGFKSYQHSFAIESNTLINIALEPDATHTL